MTSEEATMLQQCNAEYQAMAARVEAVIRDQWPASLQSNGAIWVWLDNHRPELREKLTALVNQVDAAWKNCMLDELKALLTEWGKMQIDIYRAYWVHLKQQEA